jgi:hypothetical protein
MNFRFITLQNKSYIYRLLPLLFALPFFLSNTSDVDIWWHLQIGKDIVENHTWPSPDIYSYTTNQEWVIHSWFAIYTGAKNW